MFESINAAVQEASILKRSIILGSITGGVLSFAYTAVVIPLAGILIVFTNIPSGKIFDALIGAGAFAICAWPFAMIMGVFPGIILGAMGGIIIGLIVLPLRTRISSMGTGLIGLLAAIGTVILAHRYLYPGLIDVSRPEGIMKYLPYLFWLAGPSLLLLLGMTWVGWKMYAGSSKNNGN